MVSVEVELVSRELQLVTKVALPPFQVMPGVIQWGSRTFVRQPELAPAATACVYTEVFCYVVPILSEAHGDV